MRRSRPGDVIMIERAEHTDGFTIIQNEALRDERLSIEARGLLAFMLTMTDGWDFSIKGLAAQTNLTEHKTMILTKELKEAGYLEQRNTTNSKGAFVGREWIVYEVPALSKNRTAENPHCGKTELRGTRTADSPHCGKVPVLRSTNYKEVPNKRSTKEKEGTKRFKPPTVEEVRAYCQERKNGIDPETFVDHYTANGWKVGGKSPMKDWKAAVRTWEKRDEQRKAKTQPITENPFTRLRREEGFE